jgi:hypothetical protein
MMAQDETTQALLTALDTMARDVTEWEAGFLDSCMRQTYPLTPKQRAVLVRMADQYVPHLAAELRGQLRLLR